MRASIRGIVTPELSGISDALPFVTNSTPFWQTSFLKLKYGYAESFILVSPEACTACVSL